MNLKLFFCLSCHLDKRSKNTLWHLDGMAIRNASRGDSREFIRANRFADKKKPYLHNVRAIRANRLKPALRCCLVPRSAIRKKGVHFGNPETIRENQMIRANLRIDSCESGRVSSGTPIACSKMTIFCEDILGWAPSEPLADSGHSHSLELYTKLEIPWPWHKCQNLLDTEKASCP